MLTAQREAVAKSNGLDADGEPHLTNTDAAALVGYWHSAAGPDWPASYGLATRYLAHRLGWIEPAFAEGVGTWTSKRLWAAFASAAKHAAKRSPVPPRLLPTESLRRARELARRIVDSLRRTKPPAKPTPPTVPLPTPKPPPVGLKKPIDPLLVIAVIAILLNRR